MDQHRAPAADRPRLARGALDFHPLDYEDVFSRNQRPKIDEYDDYLFIVLHFARFDKRVSGSTRPRSTSSSAPTT